MRRLRFWGEVKLGVDGGKGWCVVLGGNLGKGFLVRTGFVFLSWVLGYGVGGAVFLVLCCRLGRSFYIVRF